MLTTLILSLAMLPQDSPKFVIEMDTSQAPEMKAWADHAKKEMEKWYVIMEHDYPSPGYTPSRHVVVFFDPNYDGVAGTGGDHIGVSTKWLKAHPEDYGCLIHELAHVIQSYPKYDPTWLVEGIADYIRWLRYEPGKNLIPVRLGKTDYHGGYGPVGKFLMWTEKKYNKKDLVKDLNAQLRQDKYTKDSFKNLTGKNFNELWDEFLKDSDWTIGAFTRDGVQNPILKPDQSATFEDPMTGKSVNWQYSHVFNPAATVKDGKVVLLPRCEDQTGNGIGTFTSRVGYAASDDGLRFKLNNNPVLYPAKDNAKEWEWSGGCEDPRIVKGAGGQFILTYTAYDRKVARLMVATSKDLIKWDKKGPVFAGTSFENSWSKSGSIVSELKGDELVAKKIDGKYWMYWGEGTISAATSTDLIHWKPVVDDKGTVTPVLRTRRGQWDSNLVEPGPPAVWSEKGIVLIYNAKNDADNGDKKLAAGIYCTGQVLFNPGNPMKAEDRLEKPFLKPEDASEVTGQYKAGTTFAEGLVYFKGRWILYFGSADSFVGAAVSKGK